MVATVLGAKDEVACRDGIIVVVVMLMVEEVRAAAAVCAREVGVFGVEFPPKDTRPSPRAVPEAVPGAEGNSTTTIVPAAAADIVAVAVLEVPGRVNMAVVCKACCCSCFPKKVEVEVLGRRLARSSSVLLPVVLPVKRSRFRS
jgi:hypothetical protein